MINDKTELKDFLDHKVEVYNQPDFIESDPISIPHQFSRQQDIEITGFIAAVLAWGQRKTIINKCNELFALMDNAPYDFIVNHQESDLKRFLNFKHRTFNPTDTLYFIHFFQNYYQKHETLEAAFLKGGGLNEEDFIKRSLIEFHQLFFKDESAPQRTRKHIATPERNSACKRINMFLRWMVRKDDNGVDFGIWKQISPSVLICPCDVHVERVARHLGLMQRTKADWKAAEELTQALRNFDPEDPVKYDFALFGLGVVENYAR